MSRNGSGVYSLPAGNPVVTGTTISSSWANTTLSDIATALTGSVAADGQTAMTGNLQMGNNKITGLAVATASGDALSYGQAATISALTVSGAFSANGGATLGDASGDALTINSSAVSIPNGLNFDSNTFVIDAGNNRVGVGIASPTVALDVNGAVRVGVASNPTTIANNSQFYDQSLVGPTISGYNFSVRTGNPTPTEVFRITDAGNVGIGTSSPTTIVHAQKASGNTYYRAQNNLANVDFGVDGAGTGILWNNSNYPLAFGTNNTERMRIDSSGNVGIGTSSPNYYAGFTTLTLNNASTGSALDWNVNGTRTFTALTNSTTAYLGSLTSIPVTFLTNNTERMRIDSSGNVGIGTSSPANFGSAFKMLAVQGSDYGVIQAISNSGSTTLEMMGASGIGYVGTRTNHPLAFRTNDTERMRIDSSGNLLLNTTSNANNATLNVSGRDYWAMQVTCLNSSAGLLIGNTSGTSAYNALAFYSNGFSTPAGTITVTGGSTSYNTSSDYRLKESIAPMTGALDKVALLKPCTYTWKLDGSEGQGFIAHELAEVCPSAVTGEKDAVFEDGSIKPQGIDTSFLVATLTAAIQELNAKVDSLQAELNTLKG